MGNLTNVALTPSHRILLIEDDADDQFFFMDALAKLDGDYFCEIVQNGIEALEELASGSDLPSLIFLDLNMPLMNGFECLSLIRQGPAKEIPVVVISTSRNPRDKIRVEELGVSCFLEKSGDHRELRFQLADIFRNLLL